MSKVATSQGITLTNTLLQPKIWLKKNKHIDSLTYIWYHLVSTLVDSGTAQPRGSAVFCLLGINKMERAMLNLPLNSFYFSNITFGGTEQAPSTGVLRG